MTVIVDTCVFFAFYSIRDRYHLDALGLVAHLVEGRWGRAYITCHILDETLNILKYRLSPETARAFMETFIDGGVVEILYLDKGVEDKALRIFRENIFRRGFSYTDAVTVATIDEYGIGYLLTFDVRSFSGLVDNIIGVGYWSSLAEDEKNRILKLVREVLGSDY